MPIVYKKIDPEVVPNAPAGKVITFVNPDGILMQKDASGNLSQVGATSDTPPASSAPIVLINAAALKAYTGDEAGLYVYCYTKAGVGGGWFNRIDGDANTVADNGMTFRDGLNRLWMRPVETQVTPQLYGAWMDNDRDDSAEIIAADTYCGTLGTTLHLLGGPSYMWRKPDEYKWQSRHIVGQESGIDRPGTGISFAPAIAWKDGTQEILADPALDLMGCMVMTMSSFRVENVNIQGQSAASTANLLSAGYITDASQVRKYSSWAPGLSAFKTDEGGTGKFINCTTSRTKVGLYLNSTDGHVFWDDCSWGGIWGVYCKKNSGDFFMNGGGAAGAWAGIVFGNTEWAGHLGGMELSMLRVHMGFCPYPFYQVDDSPDDVSDQDVGGLSGSFYSVSFEEVGEAAVDFLPNSVSSPSLFTHTGSAFAPPGDDQYRLPAELVPAVGSQKYWMKFGKLTSFDSIDCQFDASPYSTAAQPFALYTTGISGKPGARLDLNAFSSIDYLDGGWDGIYPTANEVYVPQGRGNGEPATKDDLRLTRAALPVANLFAPEQLGALALGTANNVAKANGGIWDVFQTTATLNKLSAWKTANEFTGFTFPRGFYEELGTNPGIIKVALGSGFTNGSAHLAYPAAITEPSRLIVGSFWVASKNPVAGNVPHLHFYMGGGGDDHIYDAVEEVPPLIWRKLRMVCNKSASGVYSGFDFGFSDIQATGAFYIAGLMNNWDEAAPYNPNQGVTLNGPVYYDNPTTQTTVGATGTAAAPPTKPAIWVVEWIGGKKYVSPKYAAS